MPAKRYLELTDEQRCELEHVVLHHPKPYVRARRSEEFLGKALQGVPRDRMVVGSKIWPTNLRLKTLVEHCEASLKRLGCV